LGRAKNRFSDLIRNLFEEFSFCRKKVDKHQFFESSQSKKAILNVAMILNNSLFRRNFSKRTLTPKTSITLSNLPVFKLFLIFQIKTNWINQNFTLKQNCLEPLFEFIFLQERVISLSSHTINRFNKRERQKKKGETGSDFR